MLRKYVVLLAILALVGCNVSPAPTTIFSPTLATTSQIVATIQLPTTIPRPFATHTPAPMATKAPTITPTPIPTLTADETQALVRKMLQDNGGCELPCWWGGKIVPGQTTYVQANDFFSSQGVPLFSRGTHGQRGFDIPNHAPPFDYNITVTVDSPQGTVESIRFNGAAYGGKHSVRFAQDWAHYAWYRILTQNGPPQQIRAQFFPTTYGGPAGYKLILFYETLGMAIEYRGSAQDINNSRVRACPKFGEVTAVDLTLLPPAEDDSLITFVIPSGDVQFWPSLEEATGMSVEAFYKEFKDANSQVCMNSPTT
jgi:hypothetical protein